MATNADQSDKNIAHTPDNPQVVTPDEQQQFYGVTEADRTQCVEIITKYRTQWQSDRRLRIPMWMRNVMMDRGQQELEWDGQNNTYVDAFAYYRANGGNDRNPNVDQLRGYCNNITQMLKTGYVGTMSRGVPPTVIRPENAEILADVTTAKAAQEAISIVERMNHIRGLVRLENSYLFLFGVYFKYTRYVLDGAWAGWNEDPIFGEVQVNKPHRLRCPKCAKETPLTDLQPDRSCPECQTQMGPGDFWPEESSTEIAFKGTERDPKGMVRWTIHGPLEIDCDPQAQKLENTPLLAFDQEIDVGAARMTFPAVADSIQEGAGVETDPNSSYARLRRNESTSMGWGYTSDSMDQRPTYSQVWMQPWTFWRNGDRAFAERMLNTFPDGCKVSMIGSQVVDMRPASLTAEWTMCRLHDDHGIYSPSIADNVVPFNERFNDAMDLIDDYFQRCAAGLTLADASKIDDERMKQKTLVPGELNMVWTKGEGQRQPLSEVLHQFQFSLDQKILEYPNMLMNFAQLISGVVPQAFGGGTLPGIETAKGQAQSLDQAMTRLNIGWDNLKEEHAKAGKNAIDCLRKNMTEELWSVIEANGSEFRNNYVHLSDLQGRIQVYPDIDSGLPQSPEQIRQTFQSLLEMAVKDNPIAMAIIDVLPNQEQMMAALGTPDMVIPGAAQRAWTQQDIRELLETDIPGQTQPDGSIVYQLPVQPIVGVTEWKVAKETVQLFCQENSDLQKANPNGWARLMQYNKMLLDGEMQDEVQKNARGLKAAQAGKPQPPQADPTIQQAKQDLLARAQRSVDRLSEIGEMPPLGKNGSIASQTSAEGKILDTALKAISA